MIRVQIAIFVMLALNAVLLGISTYANFRVRSEQAQLMRTYVETKAVQAETWRRIEDTNKSLNDRRSKPCSEGMTLLPGETCTMDIPAVPMPRMPQPQIQTPPPGRPL